MVPRAFCIAVGIALFGRTAAQEGSLGRNAAQDPVRVASSQELKAAILNGAPHIVLTEHIDAREIPDAACSNKAVCGEGSKIVLQPQATLRSIRVGPNYLSCSCCSHMWAGAPWSQGVALKQQL